MPSTNDKLFQETLPHFLTLGYNELDCLVYMTTLPYGSVSMVTIARLTNKARSTIYESVKRLVAKGILVEEPQAKTTHYRAISIEQFLVLIQEQSKELHSVQEFFAQYKDQFDTLKSGVTAAPLVKFYGTAEITSVMWKQIKKSEFVRSIRDIDRCMEYFALNIEQTTELANTSLRITHRILYDSPAARAYKKKHQSKTYRIKLCKEPSIKKADVMIMDGSYFHTSYDKQLVGMQINDKQIFDLQAMLFDQLRSNLS